MAQDYTEVIVRYGRFEPCYHCHWKHQCDIPRGEFNWNGRFKSIKGVFRCFDFVAQGQKPTHPFGS